MTLTSLYYLLLILPVAGTFMLSKDARRRAVMLPLLICFVVVSLAVKYTSEWEYERHRLELQRHAEHMTTRVQATVSDVLDVLGSVESFYASSTHVDRSEFRIFVSHFMKLHPSIQAIEWVPRVSELQRNSIERSAQTEGFESFQFTERNQFNELVRRSQQSEYFPVLYVEPIFGNEKALGFDLGSDPVRLQALNESWTSRKPVSTGPLYLVQENGNEQGFLVSHPIFMNGNTSDASATQINQLHGFAIGVFRISDIIAESLTSYDHANLSALVYDDSASNDRIIYSHGQTADINNADSVSTSVEVGNRSWKIAISPSSNSKEKKSSVASSLTLLAGMILLCLLASFLRTVVRNVSQTEAAVKKRTVQLDESNAQLVKEIGDKEKSRKALEDQRLIAFNIASDAERAKLDAQSNKTHLDAVLNATPSGIITADTNGTIISINEMGLSLFGYTLEELVGNPIQLLLPPRNDAEFSFENMKSQEMTGRQKNGRQVAIVVGLSQVETEKGRFVLATIVDISARKEAELNLRESAAELRNKNDLLEQRNKELDEFSYVASHDLQEPLRKLTTFCGFLVEDLDEALTESAAKDIEIITESAARMKVLIQDLLSLSRAGRQEFKKEPVKLETCISHAVSALTTSIEEQNAVIVRENALPESVVGDRMLLTQLFQNLISNALKFIVDKPPVIEITARRANIEGTQNEVWIFGVKDNGIGIKPEYMKKIFEPFKKLHGRQEYAGSGIGLAICYKAIDRHEGRIWVESEQTIGSHFQFTLWNKTELMLPENNSEVGQDAQTQRPISSHPSC